MNFIGMRPFKILVHGDTIYVYCPDNSVFARDQPCFCYSSKTFVQLKMDKDALTHYEPYLCVNLVPGDYPQYFVATSQGDFKDNIAIRKLGSVDWDGDKWVVDQDVIGKQTFDIDAGLNDKTDIWGTVSQDGTYIETSDGRVFSTGATEEYIDSGMSPQPGSVIQFTYR